MTLTTSSTASSAAAAQRSSTASSEINATSVKCPYCDKIFNHQRNLTVHINLVHKKTLKKCPHCTKSFKERHKEIDINKVHNVVWKDKPIYRCVYCSKVFYEYETYQNHIFNCV